MQPLDIQEPVGAVAANDIVDNGDAAIIVDEDAVIDLVAREHDGVEILAPLHDLAHGLQLARIDDPVQHQQMQWTRDIRWRPRGPCTTSPTMLSALPNSISWVVRIADADPNIQPTVAVDQIIAAAALDQIAAAAAQDDVARSKRRNAGAEQLL